MYKFFAFLILVFMIAATVDGIIKKANATIIDLNQTNVAIEKLNL